MAYANMRGNMPCWTKIYAIFWDHHRAWFPEKNPQHRNIYKLIQCCAVDFFFPQNTLGHGPAFWIFFQDSRIRVKHRQYATKKLLPSAFLSGIWRYFCFAFRTLGTHYISDKLKCLIRWTRIPLNPDKHCNILATYIFHRIKSKTGKTESHLNLIL